MPGTDRSMLREIVGRIKGFFRPPPSEASRLDPHTALAGLFIETCFHDGGLTGQERKAIDEALARHCRIAQADAQALRVRAEEVQWTSLTSIGFAVAAAKGLDEDEREAVIRTMIGFVDGDDRYDVHENRLIMSTANCFGIPSSRVREMRRTG